IAAGSSSPRPSREPRVLHRRGLCRGLRGPGRAGDRLAGRPSPGAPRDRRARPREEAVTAKRRRLWLLVGSLAVLGVAAALVLTALNDNIVFFYSPSQLAEKKLSPDRRFRLGGLVEQGSVKKDGQEVRFKVTDLKQSVAVVYRGLLPDLFREGQGVIAEGSLGADGVFTAREVLAKHDENYMPPEVAKALKESGRWQEGSGK